MKLEKQQRAVGIFANFSDLELAVSQLKAANLPLIKVSILCTLTSSLGNVLSSLEISEAETKVFSDLISQGYYLVIVQGSLEAITTAERIFYKNSIEDGVVYSASSLSPGRYKNAVGVFFNLQDVKQALIQLQASGYPMKQIYLLTKEMFLDKDIPQIKVFSNDQWMKLEIPENIAINYKHYLSLDGYLIVLGGTEIQIAAAKSILAVNQVKNFSVYHPLDLT